MEKEPLAMKFMRKVFWEPLLRSIPEQDIRDIKFVPRTNEEQERVEIMYKLTKPTPPNT